VHEYHFTSMHKYHFKRYVHIYVYICIYMHRKEMHRKEIYTAYILCDEVRILINSLETNLLSGSHA
jgi:hypothetical protein